MAGQTLDTRTHSTTATCLSPLDPLKYAMLCSQAMAMIGDENFAPAAELSERACHLPDAHF